MLGGLIGEAQHAESLLHPQLLHVQTTMPQPYMGLPSNQGYNGDGCYCIGKNEAIVLKKGEQEGDGHRNEQVKPTHGQCT